MPAGRISYGVAAFQALSQFPEVQYKNCSPFLSVFST